jgi:hypothetical protein
MGYFQRGISNGVFPTGYFQRGISGTTFCILDSFGVFPSPPWKYPGYLTRCIPNGVFNPGYFLSFLRSGLLPPHLLLPPLIQLMPWLWPMLLLLLLLLLLVLLLLLLLLLVGRTQPESKSLS